MADQPKPPLWRVLASVFAGWTTYPPQPPRCYWAALIRALADWLVPEEIEPPSPEGEPWPQSYQLMSDSKWEQRQMIRQYLLDEANKAEMGL